MNPALNGSAAIQHFEHGNTYSVYEVWRYELRYELDHEKMFNTQYHIPRCMESSM